MAFNVNDVVVLKGTHSPTMRVGARGTSNGIQGFVCFWANDGVAYSLCFPPELLEQHREPKGEPTIHPGPT